MAGNKIRRKAPSEAYRDVESSSKPRSRSVLVMPDVGKTASQTVESCELAKLYAKQTKKAPLTKGDDPATLVELYKRQEDCGPVLLNSTMTHNYLGNLSPSFVRLLQDEAQAGLDCINSKRALEKPFSALVLREARFWSRFDAYLSVPLDRIEKSSSSLLWGHDWHDVGPYESIARGMVRVLRMALGNRIKAIRLLTTGNGQVEDSSSSDSVLKDSDENQAFPVTVSSSSSSSSESKASTLLSPTSQDHVVIGITLNTDTCARVVDRGPPANDTDATKAFTRLWGSKAQLRRFKDGAIVHAVVWEQGEDDSPTSAVVRFENEDLTQGGIVERIMRHILELHFLKTKRRKGEQFLQFSLRDVLSPVDGVTPVKGCDSEALQSVFRNPLSAHRLVGKAFESLSQFLAEHSKPQIGEENNRLGLPLPIDGVEPLSPALRYAALFPPVPHPSLGGPPSMVANRKKLPGAITSDPIEIQVRFGASSKWPTDLRAMGAAKTAMLVTLANGIDAMRDSGEAAGFDNVLVTPAHADISFRGYAFRVSVRADAELRLLHRLHQPNAEAVELKWQLTKQHVIRAMHHSMVRVVYTTHASSPTVTRLAHRWVAGHLLSAHLPFEAIELLVVNVYTASASSPGTVVAGFFDFLRLLATHDWAREPLIVDPQGQLDTQDLAAIQKQFDQVRGPEYAKGPALYIITPNDYFSYKPDDPATDKIKSI